MSIRKWTVLGVFVVLFGTFVGNVVAARAGSGCNLIRFVCNDTVCTNSGGECNSNCSTCILQ